MIDFLKNIGLEKLVALVGLIIASISLGWNILNEIRKQPRARITVMVAKLIQTGNPISEKDNYFHITISNLGTRPILIKGIASLNYKWWWPPFKKQWYIIVPEKLPIYLKDGEDHYESFPYNLMQFKELLDRHIQRIVVWDSGGCYHWVSRRQMREFRRNVRKLLRKEEIMPR